MKVVLFNICPHGVMDAHISPKDSVKVRILLRVLLPIIGTITNLNGIYLQEPLSMLSLIG